jgi:hypothetical protein
MIDVVDEIWGIEKFGGRKDTEVLVQQAKASKAIARTIIGVI